MMTDIYNYVLEDIYNLDGNDAKKKAFTFKGESFTFEETKLSVNYLADLLIKKGIKKGDHVTLLSFNSYAWIIAFFAIIRIGAVAVLQNYILRHDALVSAVKNSDSSFVVYGKYVAFAKDENEFSKLLEDTNILQENTLYLDDINFKEVIKDYKEVELPAIDREVDSKRTSHIIFTTGTTSEPKAVMLSQYGVLNIIYHGLHRLDSSLSSKFMCLLPMFHCFGLLVVLAFAAYKRNVCINQMADPLEIYKEFSKEKCGEYASVSIIFDKLARVPFFRLRHSKHVKHCIVGGGFTSEKGFNFLEKKYGRGKFMNGYGQTECSPLISLVYPGSPASKQRTTVGKIMDDIDVIIQDVNTKEDITNLRKPGEILIKGYIVCNGYYKLPEEKQPFDKDGYLHTGDMGYIDEDGYLVLTGRLKDIIIRKGENISPAEIEKAFEKYKEFSAVRVLGFPSLTDGEFIMAAVELKKKPLHFHESWYIKELHSVLPSIKIPSHIIYMPSFPLAANGKLDERKLREICMDKLNKIVDHDLYKEVSKIQKGLKHK